MMTAARVDLPYFTFEADIETPPEQPTHCRGCEKPLEPLRRYGGLCRACVASRSSTRPLPPAPTEHLRSHMTYVRTVYRQRVGHRERYVEARCDCGRARTLKWSTWAHHQPRCCNACRLRGIDAHGFEAEHVR